MAIKGFRAAFAATSSASVTVGALVGNASGGGLIRSIDVAVGTTTPADLQNQIYIDRLTSFGTMTAISATSVAADRYQDQSLHNMLVKKEASVEPTYSSTPFYNAYLNQRVALHIELGPGNEWEIPPTASAGIGVRVASTGTPVAYTCFSWRE